jgi:hypothetical protein
MFRESLMISRTLDLLQPHVPLLRAPTSAVSETVAQLA